ncbi:hypothetical protein [Flagellimonas okinawensis]|uniref:Uncharacterized protein n=1 Tax=Flagellimonas okinawensis TaxID=3031324 RepID=A0ABT5XRK2_9FLAO|nr:hypothetical protein [[Muricauda] okinawensis]MDF0708525.1 hypothetical protein [[Muricauda] okinawensis]
MKDVYLKLESNTQESEEGLLKLINNPKIPTYLKEDIVAHSTTKVDSFSKLDEPSELMNFLLDTSNIQANWAIVIDVFEKNEATFPEPLNQFLNYEENCDQLSRETLIGKTDGYKEFRIAFLLNDKIEDTLYQNYLNAFPYTYKDLNFESLSKRKVQSLVEQQKIAFTPTNYNKLKSKFPDLHLHLSLNNMTDFFENYAAIANVILEEDLIGFLENQKLSDSNKIKLLERYDIDNHIIEPVSLTLIGNLLLKHPVLKLSTENLKSVLLKSNLSQVQRIELYLRQPTLFDNEFISNFLNILGGEFPKLNKKGPMPSFENRPVLISFFQYLKKIGKISKVKSNGEGIMVTTFRN